MELTRLRNIVYFFRWIIHNYSTPFAIQILKALLPALKPGARVIINDHCLREPGQENPWDESIMRGMDMVMLSLLNAQERTEAEFKALFKAVSEDFVFEVNSFLRSVHSVQPGKGKELTPMTGRYACPGMPDECRRGSVPTRQGCLRGGSRCRDGREGECSGRDEWCDEWRDGDGGSQD
jgi:hypothetical protein